MAEFIASAFDGDFDAVYLVEVKRRNDGDALSFEYITELLPSVRFGKITERRLLRMKEVFANENDINSDDKWLEGRLIHGYHFLAKVILIEGV